MKLIAILLNFFLLVFCIFHALNGGTVRDASDIISMFLLYATSITSLGFFLLGGESWLGLYFKRKALEEKHKIPDLKKRVGYSVSSS